MIQYLIRNLPGPIKRWLWKQFVVGEHAGIMLADTSRRRGGSNDFCQQTGAALELIRQKDPRRFNRVQRHLRYIVNGAMPWARGAYDEASRACMVDFDSFKFEKYAAGSLIVYAATIVHEATHGEIERRGITWARKSRQRIEHLCHLETARFVRRIKKELGEGWLARAYKPDSYEWYWHQPFWKRALLRLRRRRGEK